MKKDSKYKGRKTKFRGIYKMKDGRFRVRIQVARKDTERFLTAENADEAQRQRQALMDEYRTGLGSPKETFQSYASKWFKKKQASKDLTPNTENRYGNAIKHLSQELGGTQLNKITKTDVEEVFSKFRKTMKANTSNGLLMVLRNILNTAKDDDVITENVALKVKPAKVNDTRIQGDERNSLTAEEEEKFLETTKNLYPQHYPMVFLMLRTGRRIGEVLPMKWTDLTEVEGGGAVLMLQRRVSGGEVISGTKTEAQGEKVILLPEVVSLLKDYKKSLPRQNEKSDLLFPSRSNEPHARTILNNPFKVILKEAGINKRITPHGLRRTYQSALDVLTDVKASKLGAHKTLEMRLHYTTAEVKDQMKDLETIFSKKPPQNS